MSMNSSRNFSPEPGAIDPALADNTWGRTDGSATLGDAQAENYQQGLEGVGPASINAALGTQQINDHTDFSPEHLFRKVCQMLQQMFSQYQEPLEHNPINSSPDHLFLQICQKFQHMFSHYQTAGINFTMSPNHIPTADQSVLSTNDHQNMDKFVADYSRNLMSDADESYANGNTFLGASPHAAHSSTYSNLETPQENIPYNEPTYNYQVSINPSSGHNHGNNLSLIAASHNSGIPHNGSQHTAKQILSVPSTCNIRGSTFNRPDNLRRHQKTVHYQAPSKE
ncbi:uncharacterized protein JN550_002766 [Neoarthrinium moseri]|uniref:uncharacterized protein n=1 Tax=Neoarthrinium moseri TaxID=1658444 RepID=UPI001FDB42D1|nr:uncharacterized protein JN550_002766 [Neoarthrinium moseri]KAI1874187.1 hypothetical protein JN550_002766 [Neoarthrinium moseri]